MKRHGYTLALTAVSIVAMTLGIVVSINELQRLRVLNHYKKNYDTASSTYAQLMRDGITENDSRAQDLASRIHTIEREMADCRACWHVSSFVNAKKKDADAKLKKILILGSAMVDIYRKEIQSYRKAGLTDEKQAVIAASMRLHESLVAMADLEKRLSINQGIVLP